MVCTGMYKHLQYRWKCTAACTVFICKFIDCVPSTRSELLHFHNYLQVAQKQVIEMIKCCCVAFKCCIFFKIPFHYVIWMLLSKSPSVWQIDTLSHGATRVPQNTYPMRSKHCQYTDCTCSDVVALYCSCMLLFYIHLHCIAALHVDESWLTVIQFFRILLPSR